MADKELRKMNRTELIEIIYALQQNDKALQQENEELREQIEDRTIRISEAGSIAEAALSLNHVFEDAEKAARQYLNSIKETAGPGGEQTQAILAEASEQAHQLVRQTEEECRARTARTERECAAKLEEADRECEAILDSAEQEAEDLLAEAKEKARDRIEKVNRKIKALMDKYPMLREYLEKENETGGDVT